MDSTALLPPELEFACELRVEVGPPLEMGTSSSGQRRSIPILGGILAGHRATGRVLPGGADWQFIEADGLIRLDAHYTVETDDGVRIGVRNQGIRYGSAEVMTRIAAGELVPPADYYFRTTPRFCPPLGRYDWLRRSIFVGVCERYADLVIVRAWKLV